jgi:tripartite-type tricarboxylate transporter receptor subunit TctC
MLKQQSAMPAVMALMAAVVCGQALAQSPYPARPVRMIIPWPAGGTVDTNGRQLAAYMGHQSGWSLVVENRPGANSMIGADVVMKAPADGHTLMYNSSALAINQVLYPERKLNLVRDFTPISNTTITAGSLVAVSAGFPAQTLKEFVALAKESASQGKPLAYGSPGIGNGTHLTTELFAMRNGIQLLHVPHQGVAQMVTSLLQGNIALMITPGTALGPFVKQGKMRALAVTGAKRIPLVPDAPTLGELGVPGFPIPGSWSGLYGPAKMPGEVVTKVVATIRAALNTPKLKESLAASGNEPVGSSPEEFAKLISSEIERYAEVVRVANIKPE